MSTVSSIYELIQKDNSINTFNNNKELFLQFYYHDIDLIYGEPNVIDIFKYILSLNLNDENEEFPYINSKIFESFNKYEQMVTQKVYSGANFDDSYIEKIYKLIEDYYYMNKHKDKATLYKLYDENLLIRDVTGTMMVLLNSSFFNISNDNIKRMMEMIKNNKYLENIINSEKSVNGLLDKEYIYDYTSRFLFNSFFLNNDNIENDKLLIALKEGKIKDFEVFKRILTNTNINFIQMAFNNDLSLIINVIENNFEDELDRTKFCSTIINKLINNKDYEILANFIMNDERHNKYITEPQRKSILLLYPFSTGKDLKEEEVNYYLDNNLADTVFLNNLKEELKHNDWSEKTRKRVEAETKDIPFYSLNKNVALKTFEVLFKKESGVNYPIMIAAIKRLIKDEVKDENTKVFITYKNKYNEGTAYPEENTIVLNVRGIAELLKAKKIDSHPEVLSILDTAFHESRHIIQFRKNDSEDMEEELYNQYKEDILASLNMEYYDKNYYGVSYERDARICGAEGVVELLSKNYPYMSQSIEYYTNKVQKEISKEETIEKKIFELSDKISVDTALEKIISINPTLIEQYPFLKREYDLNGNKIKNKNNKSL